MLGVPLGGLPFTLCTLSLQHNDALVGLLIVAALLAIAPRPARGVLGALAGLTKFAPLALGPLFLRGVGPRGPGRGGSSRSWWRLRLSLVVAMLPVLLDGNLDAFWRDTIAYQAEPPARSRSGGCGAGSASSSTWSRARRRAGDRRRVRPAAAGVVEVAALGAAVVIALQLAVELLALLYIVWFFPVVADRAARRRSGVGAGAGREPGRRLQHLLDRRRPHRLGSR